MELNDVIQFIQNASIAELSVIKAELKSPMPKLSVSELCEDDIHMLLSIMPRTDDTYKGYRYALTATSIVQSIKQITNVITHNYVLKHTDRGCPMWHGNEFVSQTNAYIYKQVFHELTDTVQNQLQYCETKYNCETCTKG